MHRLAKLGLAAALLLGATTPALAEDTTTNSSAASAATSVDPMTTASIGDDFNLLMSRLSGEISFDLSGLTATSPVEFVAIDSLEGWDAERFEDQLEMKTADMGEWHDQLELNSVLKSKLDAGGYSIEDVVAIEKDGAVFKIYVDDRA